ncbi:heavy-metal-associated domain-containing protein [Massilia solisilvae]|uniref:Heavy-metal-associated domain-containing protein n=1 Tax=Massilia solisilvae TaxID=1811225 RepID=A0ABT2BPF5_9BURK|nr:heavy-metal-associated domain-containing protein [Massilia solisilvae]MCS0610404.1 heavy-metal-associated domain-containing protein [Massilia solisilvae]
MIHQNLQLATALDAAGAAAVNQALGAIAGVSQVGASGGTNRVAVAFDDNTTSAQEIAAVLARAGYPLREAPKTGGCCGGCGGGGH